jgi:hypothetical protein
MDTLLVVLIAPLRVVATQAQWECEAGTYT